VDHFIWWLHPLWLVIFLSIQAIIGWL